MKKYKCPICKTEQEVDLSTPLYRCKACTRLVRAITAPEMKVEKPIEVVQKAPTPKKKRRKKKKANEQSNGV